MKDRITFFGRKGMVFFIKSIAWGGTSGQEKFVAGGVHGKMAYWDGK
jgi:hypothetical protein